MSIEVKTPTRTQFEHSEFLCGEKQQNSKSKTTPSVASFKFDENHHQNRRASDGGQNLSAQWSRKRRLTSYKGDNSYHIAGSRRKRFKSTPCDQIVLPTKFLLGGNINDPLNLNSINEEENDLTPYTSPVPTPAHRKELINSVPVNINDPLNLESTDDDIGNKSNKKKKRNKKRHEPQSLINQPSKEWGQSEKKKNLMEALKIDIDDQVYGPNLSETKSPKFQELTFKLDSSSKPDKIVSPVIPQSSPRPRKRKRCMSTSDIKLDCSFTAARSIFRTSLSPSRTLESQKTVVKSSKKHQNQKPCTSFKKHKDTKFIHGNYNRYYGYRNPETEEDHRLLCFKQEWFENKDILDIGCNVGHLTLSLARDFNPSKVVGVDIDKTLISAARKNIRHYISTKKSDAKAFPVSNLVNFGPISAPPVVERKQGFPYNIAFTQGNYVLNSSELVDQQKEEYDVILALSITKWIHLNNGDDGLKRFFRRIFNHLRPGGKLILEPQPWSSYKKRKKLSEEIFKNFQDIKLKPPQFSDYLLREVGFSTCEVVDVPFNQSKGFRRPIQLYTKPSTASNSPKESHKSPTVTEEPSDLNCTEIMLDHGQALTVQNSLEEEHTLYSTSCTEQITSTSIENLDPPDLDTSSLNNESRGDNSLTNLSSFEIDTTLK